MLVARDELSQTRHAYIAISTGTSATGIAKASEEASTFSVTDRNCTRRGAVHQEHQDRSSATTSRGNGDVEYQASVCMMWITYPTTNIKLEMHCQINHWMEGLFTCYTGRS